MHWPKSSDPSGKFVSVAASCGKTEAALNDIIRLILQPLHYVNDSPADSYKIIYMLQLKC